MKTMAVEVVYVSSKQQQYVIPVQVEVGSTIKAVIDHSKILLFCEEINLTIQQVGVFGEKRTLLEAAREGDRIEIYRPLLVDPKEARRKRAKKFNSL